MSVTGQMNAILYAGKDSYVVGVFAIENLRPSLVTASGYKLRSVLTLSEGMPSAFEISAPVTINITLSANGTVFTSFHEEGSRFCPFTTYMFTDATGTPTLPTVMLTVLVSKWV